MKRFRRKCLLVPFLLLALATALAFTSAYAQTEGPPPTPLFDVNVVNQPDVRIINPIEPLPVRQVPAFTPFLSEARFFLGRGEGVIEAALPDPGSNESQRVVIEHVTVAASLPQGQSVVAYIRLGGMNHSLVLTSQGLWGSSQRFRASQPIRLYTFGGQVGIAFAGIERSSTTGSADFYFTVSGYFADLP